MLAIDGESSNNLEQPEELGRSKEIKQKQHKSRTPVTLQETVHEVLLH